MRAVKPPAKAVKNPTRKRPGALLAERVLRLDADEVDAFVDALLPGASGEFREDLSDIIVCEQRRDEPARPLAEVLAALSQEKRQSR
jgi:hypothetical protein